MKVLHVIPSINPSLGGPTHVALNIVRALSTAGIDVEIVTTNDNGSELLDVPLYQKVEYQQVPVWFLPRYGNPLKQFIFSPALTRWLWQSVRNYDLLDTHYLFSYAPACASVIARRYKVPYTMRTMGQLSQWALSQSHRKKEIYSTLVERPLLSRAAAIHCTTPDEAKDVRKFGIQTPTATIPLGVDIPDFLPDAKFKLQKAYSIPPDCFVLLFLSRLHYKKRPDLLIKTLYILIKKGRKVYLLLAGSGEPTYLNKLRNLVISLGLDEFVSFTDFIKGREKDLVLQGSDAFVLPSFSENFGIAVAEALVAGLPVITTPGVQISPEISSANAGLIVQGKEELLAQAVERLMDDVSFRKQLSENGRKLARQRYSWDAIAQQLITVYSTVIKKQRLPHDIAF